MTSSTATIQDLVVQKSVPSYLLATSALRLFAVFLFKENFALWSWLQQGSRNPRADMEGPYYVLGAPERELEEGKALLASHDDLKQSYPYLLSIKILTPKGEPIKGAVLDWWQADSHGVYTASSYRLRGKFKTDANGKIEVLTVAPGKYGPTNYTRAGHFHFIVSGKSVVDGGKEKEWEALTTQVYVCKENDTKELKTDFINYVRGVRTANMVHSYSTSPAADSSETFMSLPSLPASEEDATASVSWWNKTLQSITKDDEVKVLACGETEIRMNEKGWF